MQTLTGQLTPVTAECQVVTQWLMHTLSFSIPLHHLSHTHKCMWTHTHKHPNTHTHTLTPTQTHKGSSWSITIGLSSLHVSLHSTADLLCLGRNFRLQTALYQVVWHHLFPLCGHTLCAWLWTAGAFSLPLPIAHVKSTSILQHDQMMTLFHFQYQDGILWSNIISFAVMCAINNSSSMKLNQLQRFR